MATFIEDCIAEYERYFTDDWIENLEWDSLSKAEISFRTGHAKISSFVVSCFVKISKSILCGEYIVGRKKFDDVENQFKKYWENDIHTPDIAGEKPKVHKYRSGLYDLYVSLNKHIKVLFYTYMYFVTDVDEKLEYENHVYLFKSITEEPVQNSIFNYFKTLQTLIIPLCEAEHYLEFSDAYRGKIAKYIERLKNDEKKETNGDVKAILSVFLYKAQFLLKKLLRAKDKFDIYFDSDRKIVSRESIGQLPESISQFFEYYCCVHEGKAYQSDIIANIRQKMNKGKKAFLDMAVLMDYYCSTNKSPEQIDNLLSQFEGEYKAKFYRSFHSKFDNHALCTLRNFMYNCRLAYKIRRKDYTLDKLKKDISKIDALQEETQVKNFYPYKKALEYLGRLIKDNIHSRKLTFEYEDAISLYSKCLSKFDENIEWCVTHKFYPIQLTFNECVVEIDQIKLILPSTITRPIDYKRLREEQYKFHSDLDFFKTSQIYLKDREDTETLKTELRNIEKRYLEIGSILVGIVTFLFGSINIFTQQDAMPEEMFHSALGLGLVLVIFAALIVIVAEKFWNTKPNYGRITLCSIITLVYTLIIASLAFNASFPSYHDEGSVVNDSIDIEQTDSVLRNQPAVVVTAAHAKN